MKAAVWYGVKDIRYEEIEKPEPAPYEVVVHTGALGLCGSEHHAYAGISKRRKPPLVMGHEFAGEVTAIGSDVKNVAVGAKVAVDPLMSCGDCDACLSGRDNICFNFKFIGLHVPGAFAEYVAAPAKNCFELGPDLSFEEGAVAEPLAVGVHAVSISNTKPGASLAVIGSGSIGVAIIQLARLAGADPIIAIDTVDYKLQLARNMGADYTVDASKEDSLQRVKAITKGGCDIVVESVGLGRTVQQSFLAAKKGGHVTLVGALEESATIGALDCVVREIGATGSYAYTRKEFATCVSLLNNHKLNARNMISPILPFGDIPKGFDMMSDPSSRTLKVVVK